MPATKRPKTVITPECDRLARRSILPACFPSRLVVLLSLTLVCLAGTCWSATGATSTKRPQKPYALIYGTVWGPDNRPLYGMKINIHRSGAKKPRWEVYSDHSGEFAQRVPAGKADYTVTADVKGYKYINGKHLHQAAEAAVHIENDERADIGVHLTE